MNSYTTAIDASLEGIEQKVFSFRSFEHNPDATRSFDHNPNTTDIDKNQTAWYVLGETLKSQKNTNGENIVIITPNINSAKARRRNIIEGYKTSKRSICGLKPDSKDLVSKTDGYAHNAHQTACSLFFEDRYAAEKCPMNSLTEDYAAFLQEKISKHPDSTGSHYEILVPHKIMGMLELTLSREGFDLSKAIIDHTVAETISEPFKETKGFSITVTYRNNKPVIFATVHSNNNTSSIDLCERNLIKRKFPKVTGNSATLPSEIKASTDFRTPSEIKAPTDFSAIKKPLKSLYQGLRRTVSNFLS